MERGKEGEEEEEGEGGDERIHSKGEEQGKGEKE